MTHLQEKMLAFLRVWFKTHVESPSFDEIMEGVGMNTKSHVSKVLLRLEEEGHIIRQHNRARSIRLVSLPADNVVMAAAAVLDAILEENIATGTVTIRAAALGDLDIALAEMRSAPQRSKVSA